MKGRGGKTDRTKRRKKLMKTIEGRKMSERAGYKEGRKTETTTTKKPNNLKTGTT